MNAPIQRRDFIKALGLASSTTLLNPLFCRNVMGSETSLPNIVYILVDDLGYGDINLGLKEIEEFKNPYIKTPNLAKLAQQSLVFRHHYCASPVCSPSRAGLLTGRTPTRCNINQYINDKRENEKFFLRGEENTIPEILKQRNYQTAIFGKWHLNGADWEEKGNWTGWTGSFPKQQGFDHGMVTKEDPHFTRLLNVNTQKHPGDFFDVDGNPLGPIKGYSSDIISDSAIEWVKEHQSENQPFFLYLSYDAVHIRIMAADKYTNMYNTGNARKDEYYANVTHLDAAIGRFLDSLEQLGLSENTIVCFSSDNGPDVLHGWDATYFCYGTSYPLYGQKYQLYQGGIRVPGMVCWPGKIQPGISDEPNSTLDVLPTLADIANVDLPSDQTLDGTSIKDHLLHGEQINRTKPLYWQYEYPREYAGKVGKGFNRRFDDLKQGKRKDMRPHVVIREGDYILYGLHTERFQVPIEFQLYNIVDDPDESTELSMAKPELFQSMKKKLIDMYTDVNNDRRKSEIAIKKGQK